MCLLFFFSSRRRHTRWPRDWSSDVCSSDLRTAGSSPERCTCAPNSRHTRSSLSHSPSEAVIEIGRASCRENERVRSTHVVKQKSTWEYAELGTGTDCTASCTKTCTGLWSCY